MVPATKKRNGIKEATEVRMDMDRVASVVVAPGSDSALCAWPVPSETTVLGVKGKILINGDAQVDWKRVWGYAVDGFFMEINDDLLSTAVDAIFDAVVPKYVATLGFDIDEEGATSAPGYEPGEIRNDLLGGADAPEHIYQHRDIRGLIDSMGPMVITEHTDWAYLPVDKLSIIRKGAKRADGMSALAFAYSSPSMDGLTTENKLMPNFGGTVHSEWLWLKYLDQVLELAMVEMLGLTELGAESPYEDQLDFLEAMISSANTITAASSLIATTANVFMAATMRFHTVGSMRIVLASD